MKQRIEIHLRPVMPGDLPIFFEHQQDAAANHMAAFTYADSGNHDAFLARWSRMNANETIVNRAIVQANRVVGVIGSYLDGTDRHVTYWLGREHWGQGIATAALAALVEELGVRPLHARAAADNLGSIRVLEKCGFVRIGAERGFAAARAGEIDEVVMRLD
jgi:RimJ/RimL family protein N-acetyltransferase